MWDTERAEGSVGAGTRLVLVLAGGAAAEDSSLHWPPTSHQPPAPHQARAERTVDILLQTQMMAAVISTILHGRMHG